MKVFISWSGERSRKFGEILRDWLPGVIQAVRPYFTPDDLEKGARWDSEISKELHESHVGLLCMTPENLSAPWLLFEAGALSKDLGRGRVCPVLFTVDSADLLFPLAKFQAAKFEKSEMLRIIRMINSGLGDNAL
jgi:hypothetical protein